MQDLHVNSGFKSSGILKTRSAVSCDHTTSNLTKDISLRVYFRVSRKEGALLESRHNRIIVY